MALPTSYKTGTISVSASGTIVTGNGTLWTAAGLSAGDVFVAGGLGVSIEEINGAGVITLAFPWPGASLSGADYEIRFTPDATRVLTASREALRKIAEGDFIALGDVQVATGSPSSSVTYNGGVLTIPRGKPGAVDFGDLTVATGAAGTSVTINDNILTIPRGADGVDGEVTQAQLDEAVDGIAAAPEDLNGRTAIITDLSGQLVLGAASDGLDFIPSQSLKDRILEGSGEFNVQSGLTTNALMVDASGQAVISTQEDGLDFQPSGRLTARMMDSTRFPGVPVNSGVIARTAAGRTIFRHSALGPRETTYSLSNLGQPVVYATTSIAIIPYGQSNADTQGDPVSIADKWPAHVYVPNDGLYHYGPLNNNEQLDNLNGMTGFIPTDTVAAGKASYAVPAAMVVANRLPQNVRMIVRACGRPSRAMVANNGILYNLDGTTFSNNFLNFVSTAIKVIDLSIADGAPVNQIYVPFTHQENDKDTPSATYFTHLNTLISEFNSKVRAVHPGIKIRWMLDELAGWTDLGNAFEVRKALLTVADSRPNEVTLVGPRYPYGLLDDIHHSGLGRVRYGALLGEAIVAAETGRTWQAPRLSSATRTGAVVVVNFASELPLVIDEFAFPMYESVKGFSLSGVANGAIIQSVVQTGSRQVTVTLSAAPTGSPRLRYAWRANTQTDPALAAGRPFGNGGVRDAFEVPNIMLTGEIVKRFAIGFDAAI